METTAPKTDDNDQNQLKKWLMARTVGLPTAWNRLLNFHFVRSTKAVVYTPHLFVQEDWRVDQHVPHPEMGRAIESPRAALGAERNIGSSRSIIWTSVFGSLVSRQPVAGGWCRSV